MHGQFIWYELTTPDVDAARRFYPAITGWGTQQFDKDYTMWTVGGKPFAGIFKLGPEQRAQGIPPNWMPYVEANSVDDTARGVTSLGGTVVVPPTDIPGTGRFSVVKDPQGAVFGLYKSATGSQAWDGTPVIGRFSWHELMTTDYKRAFDFYRQLFGWEKMNEMDMGPGGIYFMYGANGKMFGGMYNRPPEMAGMPPFWLLYAHVRDVEKAVDTAKRTGGMVKQPPMDIPGGRIAVLGDPQGAGFAVHAAAPAPAAAKSPASKPAASKPAASKSAPAKSAPAKSAPAKSAPAKSATKAGARPAKSRRKAAAKKSGAKAKSAKSRPKAKAAARKKAPARRAGARKPSRRPKTKAKRRSR